MQIIIDVEDKNKKKYTFEIAKMELKSNSILFVCKSLYINKNRTFEIPSIKFDNAINLLKIQIKKWIEYSTDFLIPAIVIHPAEFIKEELESRDWNLNDFALYYFHTFAYEQKDEILEKINTIINIVEIFNPILRKEKTLNEMAIKILYMVFNSPSNYWEKINENYLKKIESENPDECDNYDNSIFKISA